MDVDSVFGALSVANIARAVVGLLAVIGACTWLLQAALPYLRSLLPQTNPEKLSDEEVAKLELERRHQVLDLQERQRKASAARAKKAKERMAQAKKEQEERELMKREKQYQPKSGHFARAEKRPKKSKRGAKEREGEGEQRELDPEEAEVMESNVKVSKKGLRKRAVKERKDRIPPEPPVPTTEEEQERVTKIVVRLVVGKPIARRFLTDVTLATVKDWVEAEDPSLIDKDFVFRTTYPHKVHDNLALTIAEAGLQGTLLLVSLADE